MQHVASATTRTKLFAAFEGAHRRALTSSTDRAKMVAASTITNHKGDLEQIVLARNEKRKTAANFLLDRKSVV